MLACRAEGKKPSRACSHLQLPPLVLGRYPLALPSLSRPSLHLFLFDRRQQPFQTLSIPLHGDRRHDQGQPGLGGAAEIRPDKPIPLADCRFTGSIVKTGVVVVVVRVSLGGRWLWPCAGGAGDERFGDKVLEPAPSKRFHELPLFYRSAPQVMPSSPLLFLVATLDVALVLCDKKGEGTSYYMQCSSA